MILDLQRLPILETERLRLEPLRAEDAADLFPIMGDAEFLADWDAPEIDDPDVLAELVRGQVEAMATGNVVFWAMRTLADGAFVGTFDLSHIDRRHRRAELGFMLSGAAWGEGYALEAMGTVVAFAATAVPMASSA